MDDHQIEHAIASKLIEDALAAGYTVDVYEGEGFALTFGTKRDEILDAMWSTDSDTLYFYRANDDGVRITTGWAYLVYGNGYHVIADASGNKAMYELLKGAEALAESYERKAVA